MHQKFTKYQEQFLNHKFQNLFAPYPYVFVLQHNSITVAQWKKIKKALQALPHETSLHVVPKKLQHVISNEQQATREVSKSLPLELSSWVGKQSHIITQELDSPIQKQFSAPLSFFGCYSPQDIKLLGAILEAIKLPPYRLFFLGLFLKSEIAGANKFWDNDLLFELLRQAQGAKGDSIVSGKKPVFPIQQNQFCNFLEVEQILKDIERQNQGEDKSEQDKALQVQKSVLMNLLQILEPSQLVSTLQTHSAFGIQILDALARKQS